MHIDKLDGRIDHSFYVQISEPWRLEEDKLQREIAQHQAADRSDLDEGVQLIELAHGAPRQFRRQEPREQRRLLNFVLSNSVWPNGELTAKLRQPFDLIAEVAATAEAENGGSARDVPGHPVWLGD